MLRPRGRRSGVRGGARRRPVWLEQRGGERQGRATRVAGVCRSLICIPATASSCWPSEGAAGGMEEAVGIFGGRVGGGGWLEVWVRGGECGVYIPQGGEERAQCPPPRKV